MTISFLEQDSNGDQWIDILLEKIKTFKDLQNNALDKYEEIIFFDIICNYFHKTIDSIKEIDKICSNKISKNIELKKEFRVLQTFLIHFFKFFVSIEQEGYWRIPVIYEPSRIETPNSTCFDNPSSLIKSFNKKQTVGESLSIVSKILYRLTSFNFKLMMLENYLKLFEDNLVPVLLKVKIVYSDSNLPIQHIYDVFKSKKELKTVLTEARRRHEYILDQWLSIEIEIKMLQALIILAGMSDIISPVKFEEKSEKYALNAIKGLEKEKNLTFDFKKTFSDMCEKSLFFTKKVSRIKIDLDST